MGFLQNGGFIKCMTYQQTRYKKATYAQNFVQNDINCKTNLDIKSLFGIINSLILKKKLHPPRTFPPSTLIDFSTLNPLHVYSNLHGY